MGISLVEETALIDGYDQIRSNFGNNIYLLRHYWGMGRDELAGRAECCHLSVYRLESGKFSTTLKNLVTMADIFKTTPGKLLDVNSGLYLEGVGFLEFLNHELVLERSLGRFFPRGIKSFVERSFF